MDQPLYNHARTHARTHSLSLSSAMTQKRKDQYQDKEQGHNGNGNENAGSVHIFMVTAKKETARMFRVGNLSQHSLINVIIDTEYVTRGVEHLFHLVVTLGTRGTLTIAALVVRQEEISVLIIILHRVLYIAVFFIGSTGNLVQVTSYEITVHD